MSETKPNSAGEYQLVSSFEEVRETLAQAKYRDRLSKPLAYWVLPTDRRLPLAFLGRSLNDLLATPFEELSATPGIGQKKIATLVMLLHRAAQDRQPDTPFGLNGLHQQDSQRWTQCAQVEEFNADQVSEGHWAKWRETVRRHDLGAAPLGLVAPSLQDLPTVIWKTPLKEYLDSSLQDLRSRKTHGEKRVRVILECFFLVDRYVSQVEPRGHLRLVLQPRFVQPVETWFHRHLATHKAPEFAAIQAGLIMPLLDQIEADTSPEVRSLAEGRLGVPAGRESIRAQARRMGVTRARVYQLLEECSKVMEVRWPAGQSYFGELLRRYWPDPVEEEGAPGRIAQAAYELFFSSKCEPAAEHEPLDQEPALA